MKKCVVVGAGEFYERQLPAVDFVVAADGGFLHLRELGIKPDLLIGDFDSLGYEPDAAETIKLSVEKNETDTAAAIRIAFERGCREFHIYGGTGGRIDHTLANFQLLICLAKQKAKGFFYGKDEVTTAVSDGELVFDNGRRGFISILCAGEKAEGVTLKGLKYVLADCCLTNDFPLGVSNEFIGVESSVTVRKGTLLVMYKRQ